MLYPANAMAAPAHGIKNNPPGISFVSSPVSCHLDHQVWSRM
jgi:hypothetical protein